MKEIVGHRLQEQSPQLLTLASGHRPASEFVKTTLNSPSAMQVNRWDLRYGIQAIHCKDKDMRNIQYTLEEFACTFPYAHLLHMTNLGPLGTVWTMRSIWINFSAFWYPFPCGEFQTNGLTIWWYMLDEWSLWCERDNGEYSLLFFSGFLFVYLWA